MEGQRLIKRDAKGMRGAKMAVAHVGEKDFEKEVLQSKVPVLVDFYAEWCGPCRAMAPILEQLDGEMKGKIKIMKVNVDEAREIAANYEVMSIPTFIIFKNGKAVSTDMGAHPLELMRKWVEQVL